MKGIIFIGSRIQNHVKSLNFLALKNLFSKVDLTESSQIEFELFELAIDSFLKSGDKELSNAYQTALTLLHDFENVERKQVYNQLSPDQKVFIQAVSGVLKGKADVDLSKLSQEQTKNIEAIKAKHEHYSNKRKQRDLYNRLDQAIQIESLSKLTKETDSKETLNFFTKMKMRRDPELFNRIISKLNKDSKDTLNSLIEDVEVELRKDQKLVNYNGNLVVNRSDVNLAIYERLLLKAKKKLGMSQERVDELFQKRNDALINGATKSEVDISSIIAFFAGLIPLHLIDAKALSVLDEASKRHPEGLKNALDLHIANLQTQIEKYINDPSRRKLVEDSLQAVIMMHKKHQELFGISPLHMSVEDLEKCKIQLKMLEATINWDISSNPKNKVYGKNTLSNYEKRAFSLLTKLMNESSSFELTESNAKFLADFVSYAEGNKEFNKRLGKVLKSKDDFVLYNKVAIEDIHKFTFKSAGNEKLLAKIENVNKLHAVEEILNKLLIDKQVVTNILSDDTLEPKEKDLLNRIISNGDLPKAERKELEKLLESDNLKLTDEDKAALKELLETTGFGITEEDKNILRYLINSPAIKLSEAIIVQLQNIKQNIALTDEEKITLTDLGKITKFQGLSESKVYLFLKRCNAEFDLKNMQELMLRIDNAGKFYSELNSKINNTVSPSVESGDIIMDTNSKFICSAAL